MTNKTALKLRTLGLLTLNDLILHLPLRYEDHTRIIPIAQLTPKQSAQIEGKIIDCEVRYRPHPSLNAVIADETGQLKLRWLHFYPSQVAQLTIGQPLRCWGESRLTSLGFEMIHPHITAVHSALPQSLTPIYSTTAGLSQNKLRQKITQALTEADLTETLPLAICQRYELMSFESAIRFLHAPLESKLEPALLNRDHPAWRRIKFDELLAQQLCLALARAQRRIQHAQPLALQKNHTNKLAQFYKNLSFTLTQAQKRVIHEISTDLTQAHPMQRLLQGDVGCGKTVVAAAAAIQAIENGAQVAFMAPTEILAEQHFQKCAQWMQPLGIQVVGLTGGLASANRHEILALIQQGFAQLIIGTQALIQEGVEFQNLGLVMVDEQHRFGVNQRLALNRKAKTSAMQIESENTRVPHQLTMSATPIPRTLAMTFFSDLDISVIDENPPSRQSVKTKLFNSDRRQAVLAAIVQAIQAGGQAYWVCPLVEESETLDLQTVLETYKNFCATWPDLKLGLVHGRLSSTEKNQVMHDFAKGHIQLLVATTVIEVGVDVSNASLMVIDHAERFGLAQLHQLRGRVGRGARESMCILLYQTPLSREARYRLRTMYETNDGFEIAQRDLELRGPGEFLGQRQSGIKALRFANLPQDENIAVQAHEAALALQSEPEVITAHLTRWMPEKNNLLSI